MKWYLRQLFMIQASTQLWNISTSQPSLDQILKLMSLLTLCLTIHYIQKFLKKCYIFCYDLFNHLKSLKCNLYILCILTNNFQYEEIIKRNEESQLRYQFQNVRSIWNHGLNNMCLAIYPFTVMHPTSMHLLKICCCVKDNHTAIGQSASPPGSP